MYALSKKLVIEIADLILGVAILFFVTFALMSLATAFVFGWLLGSASVTFLKFTAETLGWGITSGLMAGLWVGILVLHHRCKNTDFGFLTVPSVFWGFIMLCYTVMNTYFA